MKSWIIAAVLLLGACATGGAAEEPAAPSPFPVQRGTAPPPPAQTANQSAPPEGRAAGGVDFGQWRSADPAAYAAAFQAQMRSRLAGRDAAAAKQDMEANGFACEDAARLDCRIEIMERQCGFDWYVVIERGDAPVAGFDIMCLGAR